MKKTIGLIVLITGLIYGQSFDDLIAQSDVFDDDNMYAEALSVLKQAEGMDSENFELIWRLARVHFNLSDSSEDETVISENIYAGFGYAERALNLDPNRAESHKWYGILIGRVGELEGTKQKIKNSYKVAEHTLRAIELDPEDDGNYHVMGRWHITLADLSWIERTVAKIVYATPPKASFNEARSYFQKAIDLDPEDVRHHLWLGKTFEELKDKNGAAAAYQKAIDLPAETESDKIQQKEARELLSNL
jgi:tetratricopeptide (TPR) repeat protein